MRNEKTEEWGALTKLMECQEDGIIDAETARSLMVSIKERILRKYPPRLASDGSWYANIRFAPGKAGRKTLKKVNRNDLEEAICEFVGKNLKDQVLKDVSRKDYHYKSAFENWICAQQYKNENTEERNRREYRRFFERLEEGREMAEMDIRLITSTQIESLMTAAIKWYNLTTRKAHEDYNMFFKAVYRQAIADSLIKSDGDPCLFVLENRFMQYGRSEKERPDDERIISCDTRKILDDAAQKDHERKEDYMPPFAYELSALTGMRCGELAGLVWENVDFDGGAIHIVQSQKFNEATREYYIADTKNHKHRLIPITDEIRDVFDRIRIIQEKYGKTEDYVFSNGEAACTNRQISDYLQNKRQQYKIVQPVSIHAARRTLNSRMAAQGVPASTRAALLGHIPRVNENNYTYDMIPMDQKRQMVANAGKR